MDWLRKVSSPTKNLYLLFTFVALATLSACGGSGGGFVDNGAPAPTTPPAAAITVSLELVSATTGSAIQAVTSSNPGRVIATVTGISSSVIVTFTTDIGNIPVATAITDANNQATTDLLAGSSLGAGTVVATLSTGETASIVFAVGATNVKMGSGNPFTENVASIGTPQISAGGTTTVSVTIVDESGSLFTEPVDVNFSSACTNSATPIATLSSPVTTINGTATSTYLAQGCVGDDAINVTANAGGVNLSASGSINVLGANVGSIEFVSATPENIAIQGAGGVGGSENSTVVFRVRDTNGNPVNGAVVDFSLNSQVGGTQINPASATTNAQGLAQTVINSGTVATTVVVTASINNSNPLISSQSSNLVISTGIPDQDSFSLSASPLNVEGWDIDGTTATVVARLSDAFNNPVPNGTTVSFTTEGGSIEPSCATIDGECSVQWTSQNPRPEGQTLVANGAAPEVNNSLGQKYGGRVTILATAIGEESFPDTNTNGRFDAEELAAFGGTNISGQPYDLDEAFVDHNEDSIFNPAIAGGETGGELETFVDFSNLGTYDTSDGVYNGVLCQPDAANNNSTAHCSSQQSINVRAKLVIIMSGSNPNLAVSVTRDVPLDDDADTDLLITGESTGFASVIISDLHNQPMPAGTVIKFTAGAGTIVGPSSFTWPSDNHNGGREFGVLVKGATTPASGSLLIEVATPNGTVTVFSPINISIL